MSSSFSVTLRLMFIYGAVSVTGALGCSLIVDKDRQQCTGDRDCTSRGKAFADSECVAGYCRVPVPDDEMVPDAAVGYCEDKSECAVGEVCNEHSCAEPFDCPEASESTVEMIKFEVPVASVFQEPLPGVVANLCRGVDPQCTSPERKLTADENGILRFQVPPGYAGYLEFTDPEFFPQLQYFPPNLQEATQLGAIALSPAPVIYGLGQAVGAAPDPERGHVVLNLNSCFGPAEGVVISSPREDKQSITYYVLDGMPSADHAATTRSGSGGFLNFPPGNAKIAFEYAETGGELTELSVSVRAGFITMLTFQPRAVR